MRTITLELLRHGPAHNQLLSPLTQYLALCENHSAVTLQLPMEHNQLRYRLGALAYRMGEEPRQFQLRDTARLLGELLATIPGLTADMNRRVAGVAVDEDTNTHLRLVLSASELALLPFELALAPAGFPGAGQPLLLQSQSPVCITRETRRVAEETVVWPEETRVLFVVASPPGQQPVPAAAHLLALRTRLEPWVGTTAADPNSPGNSKLGRHLTVLTQASAEAIERACAEQVYTHVHILAHGCEYRDGYDTRFGLVLHAPDDPMGPPDIVSGERLATALRTARKGSSGELSRPAVVTLASCNSGNVGSVAGVGASIAHALHQAGIPMVIASQFPLSFGGSVRLVEELYDGLLWGEDPRTLLIDLRRMLHTQFPDTHDWASVTAYSSLPANFNTQLASVQIQRAMKSINVALDLADEVVARTPRTRRSERGTGNLGGSARTPELMGRELDAAIVRVRTAKQRLARLLERHGGDRPRILGLLASTEKREAALSYEIRKRTADATAGARLMADVWTALARARQLYFDTFGLDPSSFWSAVQYLSLTIVLQLANRLPPGAETPSQAAEKLWDLAEVQSLRDLSSAKSSVREWALGNLIELYLLAPAMPAVAARYPAANWIERARQHAASLADSASADSFEVFSTRRQIARYLDWYAELCDGKLPESVLAIADAVIDLLPAQRPADAPG